MIPRPQDEVARLEAVRRYALLDTPAEDDFDFLTKVAAAICGTPYAYVSLVDEKRVWYKSSHGRAARESDRDADYCSWTILEDEMLHIPDLSADARTAMLRPSPSAPEYRMYCGANLISSDGHRIGVLCVLDVVARTIEPETQELLRKLAGQVMALVELRAKTKQLEEAYAIMERLATIDELTGLLNRRALMAQLQQEIDRSGRSHIGFALVMIDLDHFKAINDLHGHLGGDAVLRGVGTMIRQRLRSTDSAGRYGGEELALLLPNAAGADAALVAEKLRASIAAAAYGDDNIHATASFGIAYFSPEEPVSGARLIEVADKALYQAKLFGRNRVEVLA